ncbi:MAG TPA: ATP-binding cassette domain-containing protein [Actinomycetes bacterium]|jgi:ABC-2 type transport system ATP-binding protein|nr:ATP-binding cassette domain-containing protein [Actinomycetes bacterium]
METVIELVDVAKTFTRRHRRPGSLRRTRTNVPAVNGLSFTVAAGEVVGYLGPNGAGKSTTVKMLTGILVPSSGRIRVAGLEPSRQRSTLARRVGAVFGQRTTLWWDLPLRDSFQLIRHLYRLDPARYACNLDQLVELLGLGELLDVPVRQLSLGQRMRGDLAAALLHDPAILYLDEPTIGLDVVSKSAIRQFLLDRNRTQGTTILLTTHDLGDVERLCDRVMVIDHGRLAFDGSLEALRALVPVPRLLVVDLAAAGPPMAGVEVIRVDGPRQWVTIPAGSSAAALTARLMAGYDVRDLSVEEPSIEDVVHRLYAGHAGAARTS